MGKKSLSAMPSTISATASPAVSQSTISTSKSSILKSSFAPSHFQLHLFASVIQSLDAQQLRIHDTTSGRLRSSHGAGPGTKITSIDWGYYGVAYRESQTNKKRKRTKSNAEGTVCAYGTSDSEICMFSPAEGKVVGKLIGAHQRGIRDFKFAHGSYLEAWSIGGDETLVQWDLTNDQPTRTISLSDSAINTLTSPCQTSPQILLASSTPFAIHVGAEDDFRIESFDSFKNPIHTLYRSGTSTSSSAEHFLAVDKDRYINIYDITQKSLVRTLIAGSEIEEADLFSPGPEDDKIFAQQMLAVVTKDGVVELFTQPFVYPTRVNGDLKSSRKSMTKKASAQVKLINPDAKGKAVAVFSASLQGPELLVASVVGGVDVSFQKIRWQDEGTGELLFDGTKEVIRSRSDSSLNTATMNGVKNMGKSTVDESKTVVVNGIDEPRSQSAAIEISSESEEDDDEEEPESDEEDAARLSDPDESTDPGSDAEMVDAPDAGKASNIEVDMPETEELSFGELLASQNPDTISIVDAFQPDSTAITIADGGKLAIPSGMSLGTVLTQSLRTNDQNLLELCLHTTEVGIVRNTIQRLDSSLAGKLLSKLAERLASRPGRYGHLLTWIQWICVAHGGALAAQPLVTSQLRILYRVLSQRTKSLGNLLLLKGKLDMLDAQLTFRKQLKAQRAPKRNDQDEPGMIYIEGGDDNWSSDEDQDEATESKGQTKAGKHSRIALDDLVSEEESDDEEMPIANGMSGPESEDEDEDEDDGEAIVNGLRAGGLVDEEAEVSDEEDGDSDEGDDVGSSEEDDESEEEEDSEMNDFINDSVSEVEDDDTDEEDDDVVQKPATKRSKLR